MSGNSLPPEAPGCGRQLCRRRAVAQFGQTPGERLRWLGEALPVMRGMLHGEAPSAAGSRYAMREVRNLPAPVQERLPILVGGGGEKVTLRLVARYADMNNVGGGFENVKRKEEILRQHCLDVGRDEGEIERTANTGPIIIRDTVEEAQRVLVDIFRHNGWAKTWAGRTPADQPVGPPEVVAEALAPLARRPSRRALRSGKAPNGPIHA